MMSKGRNGFFSAKAFGEKLPSLRPKVLKNKDKNVSLRLLIDVSGPRMTSKGKNLLVGAKAKLSLEINCRVYVKKSRMMSKGRNGLFSAKAFGD
jgi:hypothetical protein